MRKKIKNGSVELGNTDLYYVSFGRGSRTLVVLPGLSDGLATVKGKAWILSLPYRKYLKEYTVYMFSRKNKMPEGYTIREMAQDQVRAMKILGIEMACILGVSQGGMIAQYIAIDHPEVTEKLVLAVTAPYANDVVSQNVSTWIKMAEGGDHTSLMIDTAEKMYSEAYLRRNIKLLLLVAKFTKPKSYERFLRNANAIRGFDARQKLSQISCPTLVIAGENDLTVGSKAPYQLKHKIPHCKLYIYKKFGHGAFEEGRDFYDRVFYFLSK